MPAHGAPDTPHAACVNQEIHTHLTITLTGAPRGKYVFAATYRDLIGGKSAKLELPFEIR